MIFWCRLDSNPDHLFYYLIKWNPQLDILVYHGKGHADLIGIAAGQCCFYFFDHFFFGYCYIHFIRNWNFSHPPPTIHTIEGKKKKEKKRKRKAGKLWKASLDLQALAFNSYYIYRTQIFMHTSIYWLKGIHKSSWGEFFFTKFLH